MATAKPKSQPVATAPEQKEAAKSCLHLADKYLKEGDFEKAKEQIFKAKELDPSNAYIYAFQDRIEYFEQLKKKEASLPKFTPPPEPAQPAVPVKQEVKPTPVQQKMPTFMPPPKQEPEQSATPIFPIAPTPAPAPPVARVEPKPPEPPKFTPPPTPPPESSPKFTSSPIEAPKARQEADSMLVEMKRQMDELKRALEEEKKAREDISSRQLQAAVKQFRTALEKAWLNGAPPPKETQELHSLAISLNIPDEAEHSVTREVKLDAYSKAVKEMIAKRKLLKSSSSTMEWLRKVYQVSMSEYLENESKFLMDLVADQFKGTLLFVSSDQSAKNSLVPKLKMAGYAVVMVPNPESALEKIEKINPNVVLCEAEFPDGSLSGIKFLHVLRVNSKFNFLPFVLLCESKEIPQVQSSELKPNEGMLEKPIDFDELSTVMNEKLAQFREYISSL